jgi:hypothetical protein
LPHIASPRGLMISTICLSVCGGTGILRNIPVELARCLRAFNVGLHRIIPFG